jgi:hypothetical protein
MRRLGGDMGRGAVIKAPRRQQRQRGGRGGADEAVQQHRHAVAARRQHGAQDRRKLPPAHGSGKRQRVAAQRLVARQRGIDRPRLARQSGIVDTGAASRPIHARAAEQSAGQRGGDGGVADAHLAQAQQIGAGLDGIVAGRNGGEKLPLVHRRPGSEVSRRAVEFERHHAEVRTRQ